MRTQPIPYTAIIENVLRRNSKLTGRNRPLAVRKTFNGGSRRIARVFLSFLERITSRRTRCAIVHRTTACGAALLMRPCFSFSDSGAGIQHETTCHAAAKPPSAFVSCRGSWLGDNLEQKDLQSERSAH
jgi:hypothetical protein